MRPGAAAGPDHDAPTVDEGDPSVPLQWAVLARFCLLYAGATVGVIAVVALVVGLSPRLFLFASTLLAGTGALVALSSFRRPDESVAPGRRRFLRRALAYCAGVFGFAWTGLLALPTG